MLYDKDAICQAIREKKILTFTYNQKRRSAEPHVLGYNNDGDLTLGAWVTTGVPTPGWRDFHVAKLSGLSIAEAHFERPRPIYNPNDSTLARIICQL
jgi:hypothetical protein